MNDHLLFINHDDNAAAALPPLDQVQIFQLWQVYLENVDPLLKVTHTPTLQPRIINAVSDPAHTRPEMQALLYSICAMALKTLEEGDAACLLRPQQQNTTTTTTKADLLDHYQTLCRRALLRADVWRTTDLDCLTALHLYLMSVLSQTDLRCFALVLATALRIAQRILGCAATTTTTTADGGGSAALETELRRRVWWSLIMLEYRVSELTVYKTTALVPTWECAVPRNVNDFEMRPDMTTLPVSGGGGKMSEALFVHVRSVLADSVRHSEFHLNLVNPALKVLVRETVGVDLSVSMMEIEENFLAYCNLEDRLHYMTYHTAKGFIARSRLLKYYTQRASGASSSSSPSLQPEDAVTHAIAMLDSNTALRASPLTKGYLWLVDLYLPALAYLYLVNLLRKAPGASYAPDAWRAIDENYQVAAQRPRESHMFGLGAGDVYMIKFGPLTVQAWQAYEALCGQEMKSPREPPVIVSDVRRKMQESTTSCGGADVADASHDGVFLNPGEESGPGYFDQMSAAEGVSGMSNTNKGQMDVDLDEFWTTFDWRWISAQRE